MSRMAAAQVSTSPVRCEVLRANGGGRREAVRDANCTTTPLFQALGRGRNAVRWTVVQGGWVMAIRDAVYLGRKRGSGGSRCLHDGFWEAQADISDGVEYDVRVVKMGGRV